jgi:hypothetical protein
MIGTDEDTNSVVGARLRVWDIDGVLPAAESNFAQSVAATVTKRVDCR